MRSQETGLAGYSAILGVILHRGAECRRYSRRVCTRSWRMLNDRWWCRCGSREGRNSSSCTSGTAHMRPRLCWSGLPRSGSGVSSRSPSVGGIAVFDGDHVAQSATAVNSQIADYATFFGKAASSMVRMRSFSSSERPRRNRAIQSSSGCRKRASRSSSPKQSTRASR